MTPEDRQKALAQLRELAEWADEGTIYTDLVLERDEYYFDAGVFGEVSASIYLEEEDYEISARDAFERNSPVSWRRLAEIVDALEEDPVAEPESLDDVLDRMKVSGTREEQRLAEVLSVVQGVMQDRYVSPASGNELPPEPLPWPGALRDEIDYTAEDFPLRYQPPPGFDWAKGVKENTMRAASYKEAVAVPVSEIDESTGLMLLDDRGRIRWRKYAGGSDYTSGSRWLVWAFEREGIPLGNIKFSGATPPMAVDENGEIIDEGRAGANTYNIHASDARAAQEAIAALREKAQAQGNGAPKFAPPEPVSV